MGVETVRLSVASASRPGLSHEVTFTVDPRGLTFRCSCEWAGFNPGEPCRHVDEALPLVAAELGVDLPPPAAVGAKVAAPPAPPVDEATAKRARAAARRPAPRVRPAPEVDDLAPNRRVREAPELIRARVDLEALHRVEAARAGGAELDPLAASTLERREAIIAEAERTGVLPPPEQTSIADVEPPPPGTGGRPYPSRSMLVCPACGERIERGALHTCRGPRPPSDPVLVDFEARRRAHRTGRPRGRRERLEDGTVREVWPAPEPEPEPTPAEAEALRRRSEDAFRRHGA